VTPTTPTDFDQGFEPKDFVWPTSEYGDFKEQVSRISTEVSSTFLPFNESPKEIANAPVTEFVCLTPLSHQNLEDKWLFNVVELNAGHIYAEGRREA
jgi:hypothetical protein